MKQIITIIALASVLLGALTLSSCRKDETKNALLNTYWNGATQIKETSGTSGISYYYTLQLWFRDGNTAVCQYTLGLTQDYYTLKYSMKDSRTVIFTAETTDGDSYQETGTLSEDGNTMTYHTKVYQDDDNSWTDIILTKKSLTADTQ